MKRSLAWRPLMALVAAAVLITPGAILAQDAPATAAVRSVRTTPEQVVMEKGQRLALADLQIVALDEAGNVVEGAPILTFMQSPGAVLENDTIWAFAPGDAMLLVAVPGAGEEGRPLIFPVSITVNPLPVADLEIQEPAFGLYAGTIVPMGASATDRAGDLRTDVQVEWRSSNPDVVTLDGSGNARLHAPGSARISALAEGVEAELAVQVRANPVRSLSLEPADASVRTGDVIRMEAVALDDAGQPVTDALISFSVAGSSMISGAGAAVFEDGTFVAEQAGQYRVTAAMGLVAAEAVISADARTSEYEVVEVGSGILSHVPTSDLWAFEGLDGRDYVYTGTHAGGQKMFAWDVTDPTRPVLTDSVVVDARVVNDVKVKPDASLAVITREGASNRRNGIVVLDLADPAHPVILSEYTETLTGGVHNVFWHGDLVYAVNNGTAAMHIIDLSDPTAPSEVGRFGIDRPGNYLHDVWIVDGMAYASFWDDGVWILDVGDGRWGGTPTDPVAVSSYSYRVPPENWGNTHVAFPYKNSDGHVYLFVGDEVFGCESCKARSGPHLDENGPRGFIHVFDMTDPENLVEVAKYDVPEAGVHNLWIEDDKMYVAYYQAGLRVVDVSGELRGDLYRQGREIGWFATASPDGMVPNQALAWGPQPFKGHIFVSDLNSGLWSVKLEPRSRPIIP